MYRRTFLTGTAAAALGASLPPAAFAAQTRGADAQTMALLTTAADSLVEAVLGGAPRSLGGARGTLRQARRLLTGFVWPQSRYFQDQDVLARLDGLLAQVEAAQHDDGTFSAGNRHSPPDSAFLIEDMAVMVGGLATSRHPASEGLAERLKAMMRRAGPALRTGGVHTPNHRWELSSALAKIDKIDPNPAYRARIDEWLAEGVDINAEGIYSEQSSNYAQAVSNPSLLNLAHLPGLEGLRSLVRRNLEATIDLAEPFYGDVETIMSRRQDQAQSKQTLHSYYLQFRELALRDNDRRFAGVVRWIEGNDPSQLGDALADIIDEPELAASLPAESAPFGDLQRHFQSVGLVRERRGPITASFFAGSDWYVNGEPSPFYNVIGSGLATNPTLMRAWKGGLVLEAVRLIPDFFNMGHWRPSSVAVEPDGAVRLEGEMQVPYYLPMPADRRNADGRYALSRSVDGRFNSALDFGHRPTQMRTLGIRMTARPQPDGYLLVFETEGEEEVDVTIELTLRAGGVLEGGRSMEEGAVHLVDGQAVYRHGADQLVVSPGGGEGMVKVSSGEQYGWAGGKLQLPGPKVYVTGRTPLRQELQLRFS